MNKILSTSILLIFCNPVVHADSSVDDNLALVQLEKSAEKSEYSIDKEKLKFEFEVGCGARVDYSKVSIKKDLKASLLNIISNTNFIKVSASEFYTTIAGVLREFPDLPNTIDVLSVADRSTLEKNFKKIQDAIFRNYEANSLNSEINSICNILNITQTTTPNAWKMLHDANYCRALVIMVNPGTLDKVGNNPTVDSFNAVFKDRLSTYVNYITKKTALLSALSYVNFDIFANFSINYFLSNKIYLIGGVGGVYDLSGTKGYSLAGGRNKKNSKKEDAYGKFEFPIYRTKYGFVPALGLGVRCGKHFAIEFSGFDQITKVELDGSNAYKYSVFAGLANLVPGVKKFMPEKQSNWVNRPGVKLDFKFIIKNKSFIKLGAFYMFPTNLFRKIQPFDSVMQSAGINLSFGYIF